MRAAKQTPRASSNERLCRLTHTTINNNNNNSNNNNSNIQHNIQHIYNLYIYLGISCVAWCYGAYVLGPGVAIDKNHIAILFGRRMVKRVLCNCPCCCRSLLLAYCIIVLRVCVCVVCALHNFMIRLQKSPSPYEK